MKIGILTFHHAHNYGAVLQAYALRTVLRTLGHNAVILNYQNPTITAHYPEKLGTEDEKTPSGEIMAMYHIQQPDWSRQHRKFTKFIHQFLLEGNLSKLGFEDLERLEVDCFICGSDQIWESSLTGGLDRAYFLDFNTTSKKVSYGASKNSSEIKEIEKNYFSTRLSDFDAISVREESLATNLIKECGVNVKTVLDPTLLLDMKDYIDLEDAVSIDQKFILAYFSAEDEMLANCAKQAADMLQLPLVEIHFYRRIKNKNKYQVADCGPGEFLTYFHRAEYIFTNSFHGVVFSTIFNRPFYAVYQRDSRKDAFLTKLGLKNRQIYSAEEIDLSGMDKQFIKVADVVKRERNNSLIFLKTSLDT